MPLLTAIDEYRCGVAAMAIHAQLGLNSSDFEQQKGALRSILALCAEVDETVRGVLWPLLDPEHG